MILEKKIARIRTVEEILKENFDRPVRKWEQVDDEDEHAWIEKGKYMMENFTDDRWMYYHVDSGINMQKDNFLITAELRDCRNLSYFGYGIVFGFEKYPDKLNRFVISNRPSRAVTASFRKEDSRPYERFSRPFHASVKNIQGFRKLTVMKLLDKVYLFCDDMNHPLFELESNKFVWTGNRMGFYTEPGMLVEAKSIEVKKIHADALDTCNFKQLRVL